MVQSSKIASGIVRRHACSASSPSPASSISKRMSSRMRRATLRITRLSSTTRQRFMESSSWNRVQHWAACVIVPLTQQQAEAETNLEFEVRRPRHEVHALFAFPRDELNAALTRQQRRQ